MIGAHNNLDLYLGSNSVFDLFIVLIYVHLLN